MAQINSPLTGKQYGEETSCLTKTNFPKDVVAGYLEPFFFLCGKLQVQF
jgi:hypothetical protein